MKTLRSFPEGKRNCYTLKPRQGKRNNYLIRAYMSYGNYDNKNSIPYFHLHLGVNFWAEIKFENVNAIRRKTVVQLSPTNYIDVCLVNVGRGIPFISLLELWPLSNSIYRATSSLLPLGLMTCVNLGMSENLKFIRYADDIYGRSWLNGKLNNSEKFSTSEAINSDVKEYRLPNEVLRAAVRALNDSTSLYINLTTINFTADSEHYVYLHFFDFEEHSKGQVRSMEITFTDAIRVQVTLKYQDVYTLVKRIPKGVKLNSISITSTPGSGLPPMINAYEIYRTLPQPNTPTHEQDVDAMRNIKHAYDIMRTSWQGDPCMPKEYRWEGVTCNYSESIPSVTSLNMSSSNLTGQIATSFSNLMMLEALDLSSNQLTGQIPESIAELPNLKLLNLTGNNLRGSIPKALRKKSTTDLTLILEGNPGLCKTGSCKTITKKFIKPLVASAASVVVLAIIVCISLILCKYKRKHLSDTKALFSKKYGQLKSKNQGFSQAEVHGITNDFATEIGGGGFGKVYLGRLKDGTQVAVKLLSKSSQQGLNEFQSEAKLLSLIYHRNLVSLIGFCDDGDMRALIYEYMAKGNLQHLLSDKNPDILRWNDRLQIALDAASGLDYLHNGCKPPIIHRDIKSSNILLNETMQAKIADLGLSKAFANDTDTHISTRPAGTFGYLDPEFHRTGNLNKKSDVYSFGIILLELMTGQRAITGTPEGTCHISDWVNPKLENGDIQAIVDPRLEGKFSSASAWKFLEIAISCIRPSAIQRPDISCVVIDLKQCVAMETSVESAESSSLISSTTLETSYSQSGSYSPPSARYLILTINITNPVHHFFVVPLSDKLGNMKSTPSLWILACSVFVSFIQVVADDGSDSGEISIDCGTTQASRDENGFYYAADDGDVVESGRIYNVSSEYRSRDEQVWQQLSTLRSFPEGKRNCYTLKPKEGKNNNFLVRAYYLYGNYDNKSSVPDFDFHLGVNFWTQSYEADTVRRMEIIHVSPTNSIDVCLINTGHGTPFISLLELWPLHKSIYRTDSNLLPLDLMTRSSLGTSKEDYAFIRYSDDIYGRSWFLQAKIGNSEPIGTSVAIDGDVSDYKLPKEVLSTAIRSRNGSSSLFIELDYGTDYEYYVYLHFFDFEEHSQDQQRKMEISFTDTIRENITLQYRKLKTIVKTIPKGVHLQNISIKSTPDSGLPPMINAFELYRVLPQPYSPTRDGDVNAMRIVKHSYNITKNWQGDPCMPRTYRWEGLTCEDSDSIPKITSLNLSSSKLIGEINTSFSELISLESLDLSNNQLMGEIPEVLAKLSNLKLLNLSGNNLSGSIPKALKEKDGTSLILSLDRNPILCQKGACKTRRQKSIIPVTASVVASVAVLAIVICISVKFCKRKRKKQSDMKVKISSFQKEGNLKSKNRAFNHLEVLSITNHFETVIGEGGFGKVYLGRLQDDTQVAVKLLSKSSQQGFKEFQSEAELLMVVHHKNLVSLVGYCNDDDMKVLVYEYMNEGNLRQKLSDKNTCPLKWNERLQIALDAACGLDYLHNGCKPAIIHRDLKTANILLSKNMQAKIADFGLSRAFANDTDTHISTRPVGTFGYLDPEFHRTGNLNKKSDIYSFGIILLELMTGQPAITGTSDSIRHISDWVSPKLETGDIQAIVDPRLEGKFSSASAWKFLEIAMSCITPTAIQRPDISSVVIDLKQCLAMETSIENAESSSLIPSTTLEGSYSQSAPYSPPSAR
ncbi:probable LRR receptor-like serine/threonine-protein kinase At1g51880 [Neltuma alba]|uniref:probable LRR receptor-like serine/threonine-protein kinase At1g51880 n=1 Tax=Neltuma alba TaxID=207710 RepID=UPI0010A3F7C6|nr:probable LRR receptor-like serine/threonine-protein kinase At1g51880 [Prosopis alba]